MHCLRSFAHWAFEPTGLPKLSVIAFGDFSHDRRFSGSHMFIFRELTPSTRLFHFTDRGIHDHILDGIQGAQRMLGACPTQPILEYFDRNLDDIDTEDLTDWTAEFEVDSSLEGDNIEPKERNSANHP
ncbi:hypothetical protein BJX68DRAFT_248251 [Aspergillus pseudodeflectus]|uniref:Uncharacterized protein n=1 Tax=Aspergillus pseudodeflectus TaxID=176178 RepID=A0ABR4JGL2_9EURO